MPITRRDGNNPTGQRALCSGTSTGNNKVTRMFFQVGELTIGTLLPGIFNTNPISTNFVYP